MSEYTNKDLQRAENLRLNCKYDEALDIIKNFEKKVSKDSEDYLDFIKILVSKTEKRVQNYVKRLTGKNFGKIT